MHKKEIKRFLIACVLALATLFIPTLLGDNQVLIAILLILVAFLMLKIEWTFKNFIFYLLVLIMGPLSEAVAIYFGRWTYSDPLFIGVPLWLPFAWGNAGLYIHRLKALVDSFSR